MTIQYINPQFAEATAQNFARPESPSVEFKPGFFMSAKSWPLAVSPSGEVWSVTARRIVKPNEKGVLASRFNGSTMTRSYAFLYAQAFKKPPEGMKESSVRAVFDRHGGRVVQRTPFTSTEDLFWYEDLRGERKPSSWSPNPVPVYILDTTTNNLHKFFSAVFAVEFLRPYSPQINVRNLGAAKTMGSAIASRFYSLPVKVGERLEENFKATGKMLDVPDYLMEDKAFLINFETGDFQALPSIEDVLDTFTGQIPEGTEDSLMSAYKKNKASRGLWVTQKYYMLGGRFNPKAGPVFPAAKA